MIEYILYQEQIDKNSVPDSGAMICDQIEAGYIISAVNTQREHVSCWLRYAYGIDNSLLDREGVSGYLFERLWMGKIKSDTIERHQLLCRIATEDYRQRVWRSVALTTGFYSQAMRTWRNNWARDWGKKRNDCLDIIEQLDKEGVGQVSRMVRALRGDTDETAKEVLSSYDAENSKVLL